MPSAVSPRFSPVLESPPLTGQKSSPTQSPDSQHPRAGSSQSNPKLSPSQQAEFELFMRDLESQLRSLEDKEAAIPALSENTTESQEPSGLASTPMPDFGPAFTPSEMGMQFNPLFSETYDSSTHMLSLVTSTFGGSAAKLRALPSSFGYLAAFLGYSIQHGLESAAGALCGAASLYMLKNQIEHLLVGDPEAKTLESKTTDAVKTLAKAAFFSYGALSGFAALGATKLVGCALVGGALKFMGSNASLLLKVPVVPAGLFAGISSLVGYSDAFPGIETITGLVASAMAQASLGKYVISSVVRNTLGSFLLMALPLSINLTQQAAMFSVIQGAMKNYEKEMKAINDSNTYSGVYEQLKYVSQEEYQQHVANVLGAQSFDSVAPFFEPLRVIDPVHPENAARAVVAQLLFVEQQVQQAQEKYSALIHSNHVKEANEYATNEFRALLLKWIYLKQCLIVPFRPELGEINADTNTYQSLTTHLYAQLISGATDEDKELVAQKVAEITHQEVSDIKLPLISMPLKELDPESMAKELETILGQEVELYDFYYQTMHRYKLKMQAAYEQAMRAQGAQKV